MIKLVKMDGTAITYVNTKPTIAGAKGLLPVNEYTDKIEAANKVAAEIDCNLIDNHLIISTFTIETNVRSSINFLHLWMNLSF